MRRTRSFGLGTRLDQTFRRVAALAVLAVIAANTVQPASAQSQAGLPAVPTTKVLAIGHLTDQATPERMRAVLPDEVRETVKLQLAGKLEQWFSRKDKPGVVFIINTDDLTAAKAQLDALPLGRAGLMEFDLVPLGPLAPLGLLLGR